MSSSNRVDKIMMGSRTTGEESSDASFLKIPRIRLKNNNRSSGTSPSSPPQQSPLEGKNLKFSYIENSHLVNPNMIAQQRQAQQQRSNHSNDEEGEEEVIKPKKLPNPVKDSHAMKLVHKELLLNQKTGRSVLNHKSELQRALEKLATKSAEAESPVSPVSPHPPSLPDAPVVVQNNKNEEFQRILQQRAQKIEEQKSFVDGVTKPTVPRESEFEKIHKRITHSAAAPK